MAFLALNLWTGSPLLALWIGSRVQGEGTGLDGRVRRGDRVPGPVQLGLYQALKTDECLPGDDRHAANGPHHAPWLRSMRGERPEYGQGAHITGPRG